MNRLNRRRFLGTSAAVSVGMSAPGIFQRLALAAPKTDQPGAEETVLVVVQLTGGNDGLNTVIPFDDPEYIKNRPTLRQRKNQVLKIDDTLGFHPSMQGFADLLEGGHLSIVQGIGYPNPNRSHFTSMDIWHKAGRMDERYGWLGRTLPTMSKTGAGVYIGAGETPLAMFGVNGYAPTLESLDDYVMKVSDRGDNKQKRQMIEGFADRKPKMADNGLLDLVRNSARETYKSSERMRRVAKNYDTPVEYPSSGLGERMKLIAQLIDAGVPDRVFYTQLGGFDTHAAQAASHGDLMEEFTSAIAAFEKDIREHGHQKRVLVMTFSEFGRRIKENGSNGTDHGSGSQMFLVGDAVKSGLIGEHPDLTKPLNGDVRFHTDFRSVYTTILKDWLKVDPQPILGKSYDTVDVLKKA